MLPVLEPPENVTVRGEGPLSGEAGVRVAVRLTPRGGADRVDGVGEAGVVAHAQLVGGFGVDGLGGEQLAAGQGDDFAGDAGQHVGPGGAGLAITVCAGGARLEGYAAAEVSDAHGHWLQ